VSERTSWDLFAGLGLPVIRSSNLSALGGAGPALLAMGTYFITPSSGVSLLAGIEGSSSKIGTAAQLAPAGTLQNLNATLLEALFALTYTYRTHVGQRWAVSYSLGPGAYYFDLSGTDYDPVQCAYYGNCNTDSQDFGSAFRWMVFQQLAVDYRFRPSGPAGESETGAGLAVYGAWLPGGAWGPLPVSGISVGLLVFLLTGW
jgi:hypothetical protein